MDKLLSGRRVLVVEDEMLIAMLIEDLLGDLGCKCVKAAATVDRAIALIEGQMFDAALVDINLAGQNSHAVGDALAARGVPFVWCTGNGAQQVGDGARAVLRKPFTTKQLTDMLARLLSRQLPNAPPRDSI